MRRPKDSTLHVLIVLTALGALALSACGPAGSALAPTQTVQAVYTEAAQTFTAQMSTEIASTPATPAPSPTGTTAAGGNGIPVTGGTAVPPTGGTSAPVATSGPQCTGLTYVNDATIPDGTVMAPGTAFTKTWTVRNTGTCPWTTDYKLTFINGESMGGTSVALTAPTPAGAQAQLSVNLTAPVIPGNYTGAWQLVDPRGNRFGDMITVVIVVSGTGAASITATP